MHEEIRCTDASGAPAGLPAKAQIVWQQPAAGASGSVVDTPTMEGATLKVYAVPQGQEDAEPVWYVVSERSPRLSGS